MCMHLQHDEFCRLWKSIYYNNILTYFILLKIDFDKYMFFATNFIYYTLRSKPERLEQIKIGNNKLFRDENNFQRRLASS